MPPYYPLNDPADGPFDLLLVVGLLTVLGLYLVAVFLGLLLLFFGLTSSAAPQVAIATVDMPISTGTPAPTVTLSVPNLPLAVAPSNHLTLHLPFVAIVDAPPLELAIQVTQTPTAIPTKAPTAIPTQAPTVIPTATSSSVPTQTPTATPTVTPTAILQSVTVTPAAVAPAVDSNLPFTCIGGCATPPDPSCAIKGNVNSSGGRIYHTPDGQFYDRTDIKFEEGDRWFCTVGEAEAAGFRASER